MIKSKAASKRVRPLLGTFVEVTVFTDGDFDSLVTAAYEKAQSLEKILNLRDPDSEICRLNSGVLKTPSPVLHSLIEQARRLSETSEGAFHPFIGDTTEWDLNGIAKGFIVDKMVQTLLEREPSLSGLVNAGGDLRFFNCSEKTATLRLGPPDQPVIRELSLFRDAMATSSMGIALENEQSSTVYGKPVRAGLSPYHSVTVLADDCATADALTKIGLFATPTVTQKCASVFGAQVIIFDAAGTPVEVFEP